ncbi:MAG: MopE-related protein, partial [Myxococcota bacterium]
PTAKHPPLVAVALGLLAVHCSSAGGDGWDTASDEPLPSVIQESVEKLRAGGPIPDEADLLDAFAELEASGWKPPRAAPAPPSLHLPEIQDADPDMPAPTTDKVDPPKGLRGSYQLTCYPASEDRDGDGYAASGTPGTSIGRSWYERLTCPSGWVPAEGDCRDEGPSAASMHPARIEHPRNGLDDDCDGMTDEWEYSYGEDGHDNTESAYDMVVHANDTMTALAAAFEIPIYLRVEYGRLDRHPSTSFSSLLPATVHLIDDYEGAMAVVLVARLSGLSRARVYKSKVDSVWIRNPGQAATRLDVNVGGEWYYTSTDRTDNAVSRVRTQVVLQALYENFLQERGKVGLTGDTWVNGTRYGARDYHLWCSEFYSWVGDRGGLDGIGGKGSTYSLRKYFDGIGSYNHYHEVSTVAQLEGHAFRGDWLNLADGDHSGMFLAVDSNGDLWTVEGNATNREMDIAHSVAIRRSTTDRGLKGYGHIHSRFLD